MSTGSSQQIAKLLLKWVLERKTNGNSRTKKEPVDESKLREAQEYCRDAWDRYGHRTISKALNHSACTSLSNFEMLCRNLKNLTK